jgi:hypothetical protein
MEELTYRNFTGTDAHFHIHTLKGGYPIRKRVEMGLALFHLFETNFGAVITERDARR